MENNKTSDNVSEVQSKIPAETTAKIYETLKYYFGFDTFKEGQLEVIQDLVAGENVFVLMPTGGGKSLCYQLPALMMEGTAIVISPLIALMKNQVDAIRGYVDHDRVAHFLNSSLTKSASEAVRRDVREGKTKLLYVAPESLAKEENIEFLKSIKISFFAVDEAHCISEWGHDFRPEYRKIRPMINEIGDYPVIALTATATPKVQHDIQKNLGILDSKVYKSSFNRKNLYYEVRPKTKDIDKEIIRYIKSHPGESGIVYCLSRKKVEEFAETLNINGITALPYHAGMDTGQRADNQDAFLNETVKVIVATIAFGMGIDKPDVRFVIHYDMPKSLEGYYQETGRAGRDGGVGNCITFYSRKDLQKLDKLMQSKSVQEQEIGHQLLLETANYAESSVCRRRILLHYFGERYEEENCGQCDNCRHPKKKIEASQELMAVLEAVAAIEQHYKSEYVINILIGRATDEVKRNGHDKLEEFGTLSDMEEKLVSTLVRQAVVGGYLERDLENYGILKLTGEAYKFMMNPVEFSIVEDIDYSESEMEMPQGKGGSASDMELYSILDGLNRDVARRHGIAPYLVFRDASLEAMATTYPLTKDELLGIPGVGAGKASKFGKDFLAVIKKYVEENEIERPEDIRVRSVAKKSNTKIQIIQAIDRQVDLDELSENLGLEFDEFLTELESIVEAGTKIDIQYFVDMILDEDQQADIEEYFSECEEDDIEGAIQELGGDYDEESIRLMRVKFISDKGN